MAGQVYEGKYLYLDHLQALDACRPQRSRGVLLRWEDRASTPLKLCQWSHELADHPDKAYVQYLLQGIERGFRIGFNRAQPLHSASSNMPTRNPEVIYDYIDRELSLGRIRQCPVVCGVHSSPIGVIPKKNKPGKWRLIVDLSFPEGESINDRIEQELSSLSYASVDDLSSIITATGRGACLVKADIKEAYRMVPVHAEDQPLLGMRWNGATYIDRFLPFGLRSAPKIFTAVADAIQWVLCRHGVTQCLHYLDDFILVTRNEELAKQQRQVLLTQFEKLGVPLESSKLEGPSTCLTFLGIEVDTRPCSFVCQRKS